MSDTAKILSAFRLLASEFATIADEVVLQYIELVIGEVNTESFGNEYSKAVAYLTADTIAVTQRSSEDVGSITSKKSGNLNISFSGSNDPTLATTYAQQYQRLVRKYIMGACVV